MGYSGEVVRRERAQSQVYAALGIVQDVNGGWEDGLIPACCQGEDVGVVDSRSEVGGRYQTGHYSQQFARAVLISGCQLGETRGDRF